MKTEREAAAPSGGQVRAAISLLSDPDPRIAAACRKRVLAWGSACRGTLEEVARSEDAQLRLRARSLLRSLSLRDWLHDVGRFTSRVVRGDIDRGAVLEEGALLLTSAGRFTSGESDALRARIAALASELRAVAEGRSSYTAARHLGQLLGGKKRLTGARERRATPQSVYLDGVLRRGPGQSVALALLYVLVGRRAGLEVTAVRMPDCMLVRVHGRRRVLVDPFHDGRTVTRQDCVRHLRSRGQSGGLYLDDLDDADLLREYLQALGRSLQRGVDEEAHDILRQAGIHLVTI